MAYTLSKLRDNASSKRDILYNAYDDSGYWSASNNDRTHVFNVHYLYELPLWREQDTLMKKILGGWQVSGVTYFQSGKPLPVWRGDDYAGVGDTTAQPWDLVGDPKIDNPQFSQGRDRGPELLVQPRRIQEAGERHLRECRPQPGGPALAVVPELGHRALQERAHGRRAPHPAPARGVQLHQPPEPRRSRTRRTSAA